MKKQSKLGCNILSLCVLAFSILNCGNKGELAELTKKVTAAEKNAEEAKETIRLLQQRVATIENTGQSLAKLQAAVTTLEGIVGATSTDGLQGDNATLIANHTTMLADYAALSLAVNQTKQHINTNIVGTINAAKLKDPSNIDVTLAQIP